MAFYRRVAGQYVNQTPMGAAKGPPVLTVDLGAYRAALEVYGYPRALWRWLAESAAWLHGLVRGQLEVDWRAELGKPREDVTLEDVRPLEWAELPARPGLTDLEV